MHHWGGRSVGAAESLIAAGSGLAAAEGWAAEADLEQQRSDPEQAQAVAAER